MTDPQQNPQERLKAVRQIGLSAISAFSPERKEVREGRADRTLSAISKANAERVQDAELAVLLSRDDLTPYDKLNSIAQRTAALAVEIEGPLLPPGWTVTESISARNYRLQGGGATVSVTKDSSDRGSMSIKVHGYNTWSGYEGDTTGYVPLAAALQRAQETFVDPSKHLSPYGVHKLAEAKNKIDEIENTREQSLAAFRQEMTGWQATADRYKNALLGERNILLDKHERAFSLVQVDGVTRSKLELPRDASLTGVAFMNAATAEKARVEMEAEMPEFSPFVVWDFKDYALSKVDEAKRIMDLLVNDKWSQPGRESTTLSDAKELATLVIEKAGLTVGEWRESNAITPWEYTDVAVGDAAKMTVGVSSGGVVSIDGHPFSPENRQLNTTRRPIEDSIYERVAVLRNEPNASADIYTVNRQNSTEMENVGSFSSLKEAVYLAAGENDSSTLVFRKNGVDIRTEELNQYIKAMVLARTSPYVEPPAEQLAQLLDAALRSLDSPLKDSIYPRVALLRRDLGAEDGRVAINKSLSAQGFRMEFDAGAIPGEGHALIRVATGEAVDADDNVPDAVLSLASEWSDLADKASQWNEKVSFRTSESDVSVEGAVTKDRKRDGYIVLTIDNTENAAFVDMGRDEEIARIIDEAANKFEDLEATHGGNVLLRDTNGNLVGQAKRVNDVPTDEVDVGAVRLSIGFGGGAFDEDDTGVEIARILRGAATQVRDGNYSFPLRDSNGNSVGGFKFSEPKTLDADSPSLNNGNGYDL